MINFRNRSVGFQLKLIISLCLFVAFGLIAYMAYRNASDALLNKTMHEHKTRVEVLASTLEAEFNTLLETTEKLESAFQHGYLKGAKLESYNVTFGGYEVRDLALRGQSLIGDTSIVDAFTKDTGAVATLFAPVGDDFLRVSTSLKNTSGQRAVGTLLGKNHPGYQKIMSGQPYYASVELFGSKYLTYYQPIVASDRKISGIVFIGLPVDKVTEVLFKKLRDLNWGDTGYTFLVESNGKNQGRFLLHPTLNRNDPAVQDLKDANGEYVFRALFESDAGVFHYNWEHNGHIGDKYAVFATVPGWEWKLVGGTYISEVTKESNELFQVILIISVVVGTITFLIVAFFLTRITKPLTVLAGYMDRVGQGEVSIKIEREQDNSKNEVSRLINGLDSMSLQLNDLVGQIRATSDNVYGQAQSVSSDATQSLSQSEEQQARVEHVVTAIEEMATSAQDVATQVENIAHSVQEANSSSQSGLDMVEKVSVDVAALNALLDKSAAAIEQVASESNNIQTVTKMIDEIAEQTNLLALNAAIEAARAGEYGRGFAVVADEVRTLAHRTQTSVQEVVSIISQLREATAGAVDLMKESKGNANEVQAKASEAGMALESIADQISSISAQAETIAATSEQQATVSNEVAQSVTEISKLNYETKEMAAKSAQSADMLQSESTELKQQVDFFH